MLCKVYQTGMARQQHFLGHISPVTDITIFPAPPPAPAPPAPPKMPSSTHPSKPVQRYDSSLSHSAATRNTQRLGNVRGDLCLVLIGV